MSSLSIQSAGSSLLKNTIALQAAIGISSLLAAAMVTSLADTRLSWLIAVMMIIVMSGGWALKRRLATCIEIDRRLNILANCQQVTPQILQTVIESDRASLGWNRLVESVCVQRLLDNTDALLDATATSADDSIAGQVLSIVPDGLIVTDSGGSRLWQNDAFSSLLDSDTLPDGTSDLVQMHELFRNFHDFEANLSLLTDRTTLAPLTFEMRRGELTSMGVLRVFRQCLSETDATFLWSVRDITQQKLALEMRDCFVSAATHELRTPLSNIRAYAETLIAGGEINPDEERQFLNVILSEAARLDRTIDDLLNISSMQAGGMTLDRHETQIDRLVREVQDTIRPLFEQKSLDFETIVPPRLPELSVDKNKLAAALVNLLGNAIKYTPDGGRIRLEAEHDGSEVRFHVEDTGIGISQQDIPRLFERFFRSSDPRVNEIRGTGLGLAFAQDVARLHGGRIEVASELNKGSRFSMILPGSLAQLTPG